MFLNSRWRTIFSLTRSGFLRGTVLTSYWDVEQIADIGGRETSAEIAGGGRIGNSLGAESVEKDLVVAAEFDVLQAGAVAQGVVSEIENVIGFVIGKMDLEQVQALIDGVDEADPLGEQMKGPDAAVRDGPTAARVVVVDVGSGIDRLFEILQPGLFEPILNPTLATSHSTSYLGIHSKLLFPPFDKVSFLHQTLRQTKEFRVFSDFPLTCHRRVRLIEG